MTTVIRSHFIYVDDAAEQNVTVRMDASILHAMYAGSNQIALFMEEDMEAPTEDYPILIVATGEAVPDGYAWLATVDSGSFDGAHHEPAIWHLYLNEQAIDERRRAEQEGGEDAHA